MYDNRLQTKKCTSSPRKRQRLSHSRSTLEPGVWPMGQAVASTEDAIVQDDTEIAIVGGGVCGVICEGRCTELNIPYTIIERQDCYGGVWSNLANANSALQASSLRASSNAARGCAGAGRRRRPRSARRSCTAGTATTRWARRCPKSAARACWSACAISRPTAACLRTRGSRPRWRPCRRRPAATGVQFSGPAVVQYGPPAAYRPTCKGAACMLSGDCTAGWADQRDSGAHPSAHPLGFAKAAVSLPGCTNSTRHLVSRAARGAGLC